MTGFEPRTSGIRSNCATNLATTTAQLLNCLHNTNNFASLLGICSQNQITKINRSITLGKCIDSLSIFDYAVVHLSRVKYISHTNGAFTQVYMN